MDIKEAVFIIPYFGKFNNYLNQIFSKTWYTKKEPLTGWAAFLCEFYIHVSIYDIFLGELWTGNAWLYAQC